jgi:endo-1,4-beta-xylanase
MRSNYLRLMISILIVSTGCLMGSDDKKEPVEEEYPPVPDGRRFREIVADKYPNGNFFVGTACHHRLLGTPTETILDREFSYVTPANDFKQTAGHPEPGKWDWSNADDWVAHCAENNQVMRLHAPISPQCSKWAKDDSRTSEELRQNLEEYVTALCQRYNGYSHIKWLDVVNETVSRDGTWFGPREGTDKWENPWLILGQTEDAENFPLYIKYAFELANEHAPNLKQIINQHGSMEPEMWEKVKATVGWLRGQGLRVDGIGWQAHVDVGWEKEPGNVEYLRGLIDWAHGNNLEFHVTENNIKIKDDPEGQWDAQAETFAAIVQVVKEKSANGVTSWNLWHIGDDDSQSRQYAPCMWFTDYTPKPAYYAVQQVLEQQ